MIYIYSKAIWFTKEQIDPEESSFALSADLHHKWNYVKLCVIMWNKMWNYVEPSVLCEDDLDEQLPATLGN